MRFLKMAGQEIIYRKINNDRETKAIQITKWNIKSELAYCLDSLQTLGAFAVFEYLKTVPNPGLVIANVGIGLPLSKNDAQTIISASRRATTWKQVAQGTKLPDIESTKIWELSPNDFRLANPEWAKYIERLVKHISEDMGLAFESKNIEARLNKLVLHEQGYASNSQEAYDFILFS